jgi:hypothetical protein
MDEEALESALLQNFLGMSTNVEFQSELKRHGFHLDAAGHWAHDCFLQSLPHLCNTIKRSGGAAGQKRQLDEGGRVPANKAPRKSKSGSPRSSATVFTMDMGNSELEIAMLLTSMDRSKASKAVARTAPTSALASSSSKLPSEPVVKPVATVAPIHIKPPANNVIRKKQADPPGRRWSLEP